MFKKGIFMFLFIFCFSSVVSASSQGYYLEGYELNSYSSGDSQHWGNQSIFSASEDFSKKITIDTGDKVVNECKVDSDGTVYILTQYDVDFPYKLHSYSSTGKKNWTVSIPEGDTSYSYLLIHNHSIYLNTNGILYIFNHSGKKVKSFSVNGGQIALVDKNNIIYTNKYGEGIYAYDPNGKRLWKFVDHYQFDNLESAIDRNGNLYFVDQDKGVFALNKSGKLLWKWQLNNVSSYFGITINRDGTLLTRGVHTDTNVEELYAITSDGALKWEYVVGKVPDISTTLHLPSTTFDGTIYLGTTEELHAISPNGKVKWKKRFYHFQDYKRCDVSSPTIGADGTLYFTTVALQVKKSNEQIHYTSTETLNAYNASGKKKWSKPQIEHIVYTGNGTQKFWTDGFDAVGQPTIGPTGQLLIVDNLHKIGSPKIGVYIYGSAKKQYQLENVIINGKIQLYTQPAVVLNGHVFVPLNGVSAALGFKVNVNSSTKKILVTKDQISVELQVGSKKVVLGQKEATIDSPPTVINGSTMVPLGFIGDNLGAKVSWNSSTQTVNISFK